MILLKDKLSCRSERQVTAGSKVTTGPTQLRETFSVAIKGRDSSSVGRDWSWLPWRSSRVKLFKLCQIERKKKSFEQTVSLIWWSELRWRCRTFTWQSTEGNSRRLFWFRSRRRRWPRRSCTKPLSIRQDRVSSSFPDRSSSRIRSLSLSKEQGFSPDPNTGWDGRKHINSRGTSDTKQRRKQTNKQDWLKGEKKKYISAWSQFSGTSWAWTRCGRDRCDHSDEKINTKPNRNTGDTVKSEKEQHES